jgi:predicted phage tail protein
MALGVNAMLREIRVYGELAMFMGVRSFMAEARDAAEAMRYLLVNFAGLESHMAQHDYRVLVGSYNIGEEELTHPIGKNIIRIIPVVAGAITWKQFIGGGIGKIVAGVLLIGAAFLTGGASIGLLGLAAPVAVKTVLGGIGLALALGGVAQMLTPVPRIAPPPSSGSGSTYSSPSTMRESEMDPQKSYSFTGIQNTSVQGTPVPIIYGETVVGSVVISANVSTLEVV